MKGKDMARRAAVPLVAILLILAGGEMIHSGVGLLVAGGLIWIDLAFGSMIESAVTAMRQLRK